MCVFFFFQAEDGIRDYKVTGVQTCALPISITSRRAGRGFDPRPGHLAAGSSARDRSPLVGEYGWAIGVGIIILAVSLGRTLRALGHAFGHRGARRQPPRQAADPELRAAVDEIRQRLPELAERG